MATLFFARVLQTAGGGTEHGAIRKRLKKNEPDASCKRRAKKSGGEVVGGWVINDREGAYIVSCGARIKKTNPLQSTTAEPGGRLASEGTLKSRMALQGA